MNSFGRIFRTSIFGESHGESIGVVIDGSPAGIPLSEEDFLEDLSRRKSGGPGTTPRKEDDKPIIKSGVFKGKTTGAPVTVIFENNDVKSKDYESVKDIPRPGHADFVAMKKYGGFNDYRGGGHFSGRMTLGLVAAGVLARKIIEPVRIDAKIIKARGSGDIKEVIKQTLLGGDSVGGLVRCEVGNVPIGPGEPFFDSVESLISHAVFSIPGINGIDFGSGFSASKMKGSIHNDLIIDSDGTTETNNSGGINGGIANGNNILFTVSVKPSSGIKKAQSTYSFKEGKRVEMSIKGRHDACIALRVPVIVEACAAIVLADLILLNKKLHG